MKNNKIGRIDISELNVPPEKHEYETAKYFAKRGYDLKFIGPHYIEGFKNPDFKMCGKVWETKSPAGNSLRTFVDNYKKAKKQSEHIIFDLRRLSLKSERICLKMLKGKAESPNVKTLLVITRDGQLLTIKGKFGSM